MDTVSSLALVRSTTYVATKVQHVEGVVLLSGKQRRVHDEPDATKVPLKYLYHGATTPIKAYNHSLVQRSIMKWIGTPSDKMRGFDYIFCVKRFSHNVSTYPSVCEYAFYNGSHISKDERIRFLK
jgi:hypothetical protein